MALNEKQVGGRRALDLGAAVRDGFVTKDAILHVPLGLKVITRGLRVYLPLYASAYAEVRQDCNEC